MSKLQRFDDLTEPPVEGRFYLVRCVQGKWNGAIGMWPVWGPRHVDPSVGFPWVHYHINRYFVDEFDQMHAARTPISEDHPGHNQTLPEPILRRRKCKMSVPCAFPHELAMKSGNKWKVFLKSFVGVQCRRGNGWVCPHRGLDLGIMAPDKDGVITCPLHGVRVNAETGVVV